MIVGKRTPSKLVDRYSLFENGRFKFSRAGIGTLQYRSCKAVELLSIFRITTSFLDFLPNGKKHTQDYMFAEIRNTQTVLCNLIDVKVLDYTLSTPKSH